MINFSTRHMTDEQRDLIYSAAEAVVSFITDLRDGRSPSMIISSVPNADTGGYGCGKTALAKAIHQYNCKAYEHNGRTITKPKGTFITSYDLMKQFDSKDFEIASFLPYIGNLLVIDDLGREGTLQYEARNEASQRAQIHTRYSAILNYCYDNKISVVITTNLTGAKMEGLIGGDGRSRLLAMVPPKYRLNLSGIPDWRPISHEQGEQA